MDWLWNKQNCHGPCRTWKILQKSLQPCIEQCSTNCNHPLHMTLTIDSWWTSGEPTQNFHALMASTTASSPNNGLGVPSFLWHFLRTSDEGTKTTTTAADNINAQTMYLDTEWCTHFISEWIWLCLQKNSCREISLQRLTIFSFIGLYVVCMEQAIPEATWQRIDSASESDFNTYTDWSTLYMIRPL